MYSIFVSFCVVSCHVVSYGVVSCPFVSCRVISIGQSSDRPKFLKVNNQQCIFHTVPSTSMLQQCIYLLTSQRTLKARCRALSRRGRGCFCTKNALNDSLVAYNIYIHMHILNGYFLNRMETHSQENSSCQFFSRVNPVKK